jgi:hypothetical protein
MAHILTISDSNSSLTMSKINDNLSIFEISGICELTQPKDLNFPKLVQCTTSPLPCGVRHMTREALIK